MKKLLSIILAGTMLFSFAACGEETEEKEKSKNNADIVEDGGSYSDEYEETQIGSYITFGSYEQDNDTSNGKEDIEWLVLDKKDGKVLVISKYALDSKKYDEKYNPYDSNRPDEITWESCTLRTWLNDEFINEAFTGDEKVKIPTVTVTADSNPKYNTNPGNNTQDKVFLLSIDEVNGYFASGNGWECTPTDYALEQGALPIDKDGYEHTGQWWLRTPGYINTSASSLYYDTFVFNNAADVSWNYVGVRPAMWIEL